MGDEEKWSKVATARSERGSYRFTFKTSKGSYLIAKALVDADLDWGSQLPKQIENEPAVVPQRFARSAQYNIIWRNFVASPLTAETLRAMSTAGDRDPEESAASVRNFISSLLLSLESIHAKGLIHGSLQPSRLTIDQNGKVKLFDLGIPILFRRSVVFSDEEISEAQRYLPPERLDDETSAPTASSDIYAALSIALDALRPYRGSRAASSLANFDAQVRWIMDYYTPRPNRPSAGELHSLLFEKHSFSHLATIRDLDLAKPDLLRVTNRANERAWRSVKKEVAEFPESTLVLNGRLLSQRAAGLLHIAGASRIQDINSPTPAGPSDSRAQLVYSSQLCLQAKSLPNEIDHLWRDALHQLHFGRPLDEDHDIRMSTQHLSSEELRQRQLYLASISRASEVRDDLLRSNRWLTTAGVVHELRRRRITMGREELLLARRWGMILAIPDHGRWLYPEFQFREGLVSGWIKASHDRHRELRNGSPPNPWLELSFFESRSPLLDDRRIRDCLWHERDNRRMQHLLNETRA